MDVLPDRLWLEIFSYLHLKENFDKRLVCRKWRDLLQDFSLWTEIRIKHDTHLASVVTDDVIGDWLARWGRRVRYLQFRYCRKLTNFVGQLIANNCPMVEIIDIQGCVGIGDYGIALIAACCKAVTKVNLFMTGATDVGFSELLENVPTITAVKLPSKGNCYRNLEAIMKHCNVLETLILNDVIPFNETDPVVRDGTITEISTKFTNIRKLSLNWCWYLSDECMAAIADHCANLSHLAITECHQVTDDGLIKIVRKCPNLRKLQLGRLYSVTDRLAEGFNKKKNSLVRLKLIDTSITDKGVSKILENSPDIRAVYLGEYCLNVSKLTGEFLDVCTKDCKKLVELVFVSSNSISNEMALEIAKNLTHLEILLLSSCSKIIKSGLEAMVSSLKNLRELRVCKCEAMDDDVLGAAAQLLPVLRSIEVYGCHKLTKRGIRKFQKIKPDCNLRF